ncbi:MAG: hypothetical protein NT154_12950 [Verrucomicrobia bacterium]|nr:hypothetical protein [Verrucomicrobiota bacterium]
MPQPRTKHPDHLPTKLHFDIGGFLAECHEIQFHNGQLQYRTAPGAYLWAPQTILNPGRQHWEDFWRAADAAAVWTWATEYVEPGVCDGTQWSLTLRHKGRTVQSCGSNAYPGADGPDFPETCSFAKFLQALRQLSGVSAIG